MKVFRCGHCGTIHEFYPDGSLKSFDPPKITSKQVMGKPDASGFRELVSVYQVNGAGTEHPTHAAALAASKAGGKA